MQFDSIAYLLFLPIVYFLFYVSKTRKNQNIFLLVASYFFYCCWNPAYLLLILASTVSDYFIARNIPICAEVSKKRRLLFTSLFINLGLLFFFKYYNFFIDTLGQFGLFNVGADNLMHKYLLPVGISFYTFQTIGYTIDVYYKKIKPENNFIDFALYVSFFPQLVAGPIERAGNILPQLKERFHFIYDRFSYGLKLILIGFIKKIVFANNLGVFVDKVYGEPSGFSGFEVAAATFFFGLQILFDFSAYTDIARGSAKLFGIELMENFKGPYLSGSIREFWRRWHISLSTWFRDYLYIPLGGSRAGKLKTLSNLLIVFIITGLWHGANWTFLIWGLIHGLFIMLERSGLSRLLEKLPWLISRFYVILITMIAWIYFRAESISEANMILSKFTEIRPSQIMQLSVFHNDFALADYVILLLIVVLGILIHFIEYKDNLVDWLNKYSSNYRMVMIGASCIFLLLFGKFYQNTQFIYFQF